MMIRTIALYLYTLGLVLPPAAVVAGLFLLAMPRKAEIRQFGKVRQAA
jgi:hypothetical protein